MVDEGAVGTRPEQPTMKRRDLAEARRWSWRWRAHEYWRRIPIGPRKIPRAASSMQRSALPPD